MPKINIFSKSHDYGYDPTHVIPAEVHSDDRKVEVKFDAVDWFSCISDAAILLLAACGWGGDEAADRVAEWCDNADIERMFGYINIVGNIGFECHVHEAMAMEWLKAKRPALYKIIKNCEGDDSNFKLEKAAETASDEDVSSPLPKPVMVTLNKGGTKERQVNVDELDIPDIWNGVNRVRTGEPMSDDLYEAIIDVWHMAHSLREHIKENR